MTKDEFIESSILFLIQNPSTTDAEVMEMIDQARQQAKLTSIPTYQPIAVKDATEIAMSFEKDVEVVKRTEFKDESTFSGDYEFEGFD